MSQPWMPLYIADYMADTGHLGAAESGAYLHLIMHYWRQGGIPADDRLLARIAKMTDREWTKARSVILAFFGPDLKHARVERELQKAAIKSEARALAGSRGGNAKALNNKKAAVANATILPEQKATDALASSSQSQEIDKSISRPLRKPKRARTALSPDAQPSEIDAKAALARLTMEQFRVEWRKFRSSHIARGSLMADWHQAWLTWLERVPEYAPRAGPSGQIAKVTSLTRLAMGFIDEQTNSDNAEFGFSQTSRTAKPGYLGFARDPEFGFGEDGGREALADCGIEILPQRRQGGFGG